MWESTGAEIVRGHLAEKPQTQRQGHVRETVSLERIKMGQLICVGQECNQIAYAGPTQTSYLVQGKIYGFSGFYLYTQKPCKMIWVFKVNSQELVLP